MHSRGKNLVHPDEAIYALRVAIETLDKLEAYVSIDKYVELRRGLVEALLDNLAMRDKPYDQEATGRKGT